MKTFPDYSAQAQAVRPSIVCLLNAEGHIRYFLAHNLLNAEVARVIPNLPDGCPPTISIRNLKWFRARMGASAIVLACKMIRDLLPLDHCLKIRGKGISIELPNKASVSLISGPNEVTFRQASADEPVEED